MKKKLSLIVTLLLVFTVVFAFTLTVSAASSAKENGLRVKISTDRAEYAADDEIQISISVKNGNSYPMQGISVKTVLDKALDLQRGKPSETDIDLDAGESYTASLTAQLSEDYITEVEEDSAPSKLNGKVIVVALIAAGASAALIGGLIFVLKRKKTKNAMCLLLCLTMLFAMTPVNAFAADDDASGATSTITVEDTVTVDGRNCKITTTVTYSLGEVEIDDGLTYTRGEWVAKLAENLGMNLTSDLSDWDFYYIDVIGDPNAVAIEAANAYGLLPPPEVEDVEQDIPMFYPNKIADREFVAYTAVRAMGFESDVDVDIELWEDKDELKYPVEDAIAVGFNFLKLKGNKFEPDLPITTTDINRVFAEFEALDASTVVQEDEMYDNTTYQSGVHKESLESIDNYYVYDYGNNAYYVELPNNSATSAIAVEDVMVLPPTEENIGGYAFKVSSIDRYSSYIGFWCTLPDISEVFEHLDFATVGTPIVNQFVPGDGVSCEYNPNGYVGDDDAYAWNLSGGGSSGNLGTFTFDVDKGFSNGLKLEGSVEINIPDVTCIFDVDFPLFRSPKVNNFTFSVSEEVEIKGELNYSVVESGNYELDGALGNTEWKAGKVELGRCPIMIIPGLSIDIVFFYNVDVKGSVSITYTINSTQGYQYKNGVGRCLNSFNDDLAFLELKGSAKAGIGASARVVAFSLFDIIGMAFESGLGFNASFTPHVLLTEPLFCADVTLYLYADLSLDTDTIIGFLLEEIFHYTLEWEILKNDDQNPHKLKLHVENGSRTAECTYGTGAISGYMYDQNTREPIPDARVKIYRGGRLGTTLVRTLYTDENGKFEVENLTDGEYRILASATGYVTYDAKLQVNSNSTTYLETLMMVDRSELTEIVNVSGRVTDAVTGLGVSNYDYIVRHGWDNNLSDDYVATGSSSSPEYSVQLHAGNYTIEIKKSGYVSNYVNVAITDTDYTEANVVISPSEGTDMDSSDGFRIVLTWGATPSDLDSHFYGPNGSYHIYYSNKVGTDANLDVDDRSSYGPETITVNYVRSSGVYSYWVHDYSNGGNSSSTAMSASGAKVQVYVGSVCVQTFYVPINVAGTAWHVFDYDAATGRIIPVNEFGNSLPQ